MSNHWSPPEWPPAPIPIEPQSFDDRAPATIRSTTSLAVLGVLVAGALVALGGAARVTTGDVGFAGIAAAESGSTESSRFPDVTAELPTEPFVQMTFFDPTGVDAVETTMRVSLAERIGAISVTSASGDVLHTQFREDGTFIKASNADVWIERGADDAVTGNLLQMSRFQAEVFGTFDDFVDPRLQPFVTIVEDEVVLLPIEPIGAGSSQSETGVATRHLVLRLDVEALVEADPLAEQLSYFGDSGVLSLWVDANGLVRQQDLTAGESLSTIARLDAVMASLPELEQDLDLATSPHQRTGEVVGAG